MGPEHSDLEDHSFLGSQPDEEGVVLVVPNWHVPSCGEPPTIKADPGGRYGYFENGFGEQFVLVYEPDRERTRLWGGDFGWEKPAYVKRYQDECVAVRPYANKAVLLSDEELDWLTCCVNTFECDLKEWNPDPSSATSWEIWRTKRYMQLNPHWSLHPSVKIFVSSPSDLRDERLLVIEVCKEIESRLRIPIVPLLWEGGFPEHPSVPAFPSKLDGRDVQAVIDEYAWETLDGYHIYLGMSGEKPGTPTGDFRSGTEAELDFAVRKSYNEGKPHSIIFYQKVDQTDGDSGTESSDRFLEEVRELGLVGRFATKEEARQKLKADLTREVTRVLEIDSEWSRLTEILDELEAKVSSLEDN